MLSFKAIAATTVLAVAAHAPSASAAPDDLSRGAIRLAQTPLPRCLLYNSYRVTPQGMMQCSYQCGDRIIIRSGYQTCPGSWARPAPGAK